MEFEVEPKESYYLSYTDKLISGSMLPNGSRGLVGSAISGSTEHLGEVGLSQYYVKLLNPGYRSSSLRGIGFINQSKIIYDSIMPSFLGIYLLNSGKLVAAKWDDKSWKYSIPALFPSASSGLEAPLLKIILTTNGQLTGSDGHPIADNVWPCQYPFMQRYSGIPRIINTENLVGVSTYEDNMPSDTLYFSPATEITSSTKYILCYSDGSNDSLFKISGYYNPKFYPTVAQSLAHPTTTTTASLAGTDRNDLLKGFFGFGASFCVADITGSLTEYKYSYGAVIQGWKYGIYNGIPTSPKAIYRIGKFGQLRDMLEPRIYTKTLNQTTNAFDIPISVQFVSGTQAWLTASNPSSLNPNDLGQFDNEMRSGQPFVDV